MNKNTLLILLLILLGAGLVFLKNRNKNTVQTTPEQTTEQITTSTQVIEPTEQLAPQEEVSIPERVTQETATPVVETTKTAPAQAPQAQPAPQEKKTSPTPKTEQKTETAPTTTPVTAGSLQPVAQPEAVTGETRTISVENAITKKMLGYKYFGTHYPTTFTITANGTEIKQESKELIKIANNQLKVLYHFEFLNGKKRGSKEVIFAVKPGADTLTIAFDWKDEWRILIDKTKAEPVDAKEIELAL